MTAEDQVTTDLDRRYQILIGYTVTLASQVPEKVDAAEETKEGAIPSDPLEIIPTGHTFFAWYEAEVVAADSRDDARERFILNWEAGNREMPEGVTIKAVSARHYQGHQTVRYKRERVFD